nr:ATP-binding protein [Brevundimonas diminuta]
MTPLSSIVEVERRFGLSARLDSDLNGTPPLTGYVMQASVGKALRTMTDGILETGRRAFTWTGPYGGGKSCAALLVGSLVAGSPEQKALAASIVGPETAEAFGAAFPSSGAGWKAIALTGRRAPLLADLAEACRASLGWTAKDAARAAADDRVLIALLEAEAEKRSGLLIILDELGKTFEHAVAEGGDIHVLQDLAERASRADGRIVLIGILHQSFDQYGERLGRGSREEWAKVQGRFQNIPFVAQADEVAALLAHAVESTPPPTAGDLAAAVAEAVARRRAVDAASLGTTLTQAWPLHPVTTLLLGPVSRQRFAQNERSVFGFLSSSEPHGFKSHLETIEAGAPVAETWFRPDQLWDYLVANLGLALSVGPDGARMSLAQDAIERAALRGGLHARLVKTAALIEFFRNGSGLAVADDILTLSMPGVEPDAVVAALADLTERAILIRQPRLGGYALFAGSDFDLEGAISRQIDVLSADALIDLPTRLGVGPTPAKRHYFETGALRTFEILVLFAQDGKGDADVWAQAAAGRLVKRAHRAAGQLILLMPDTRSFDIPAEVAAEALAGALERQKAVAAVATAADVHRLGLHAAELYALERIEQSHPQLEGDRIARREVAARRVQITDAVRRELSANLDSARWWSLGARASDLDGRPLSFVASDLADQAFSSAPVLKSELLCRDRPSTSAMAGLRALAYAMVDHPDQQDLGIQAYPAERGLYLTLLKPLGLHRQRAKAWGFHDPDGSVEGRSLEPAWKLLGSPRRQSLEDLYKTWAGRPYGIKRGVMPVLALAYILANRNRLAVYLDGLYQATIDEIFVDRLMQSPRSVEIQKVSRDHKDRELIARLAADLSTPETPIDPDALPVASALFQRFQALPQWAQRTQSLSERTRKVRDIILKANDPEALLFEDLAGALSDQPEPAAAIHAALQEAEAAYPALLETLIDALAHHLGVEERRFEDLGPRAITAMGVTADLRLDAFAARAGAFATGEGDIEGLASLLVHRPPRHWSDREQKQAMFELSRLAIRFREAESFAALERRTPTTHAISIMIGVNPDVRPVAQAFAVTDEELLEADRLAGAVLAQISQSGRPTVAMAALARAVAQLSSADGPPSDLEEVE